jgi:hypothetical protein
MIEETLPALMTAAYVCAARLSWLLQQAWRGLPCECRGLEKAAIADTIS